MIIKRRRLLPVLASSPGAFAATAPDSALQTLPDPDILTGSYRIVGCLPDSGGCFGGSCRIRRTRNGTLVVQRLVSGEKSAGTVVLERVVENVFAVVANFPHNGNEYLANYHDSLDGNNRARLSGTVSRRDGSSRKCGLEAIFHGTE